MVLQHILLRKPIFEGNYDSYMSEKPSRLSVLLNKLTQLSIEQQDRVNTVLRRHQHNVQQREEAFREARRELEDNYHAEVDHDRTVLREAKDRIFHDIQARRSALITEIQTAEQEPSPAVPPEINASPEVSRDGTADLVDEIRELEDGRIEFVCHNPALPANASTVPTNIPIGTPVWIVNPLKLSGIIERTFLKAEVVGIGRGRKPFYKLKVWNPVHKKYEEHKRIRKNLAVREV